MIRRRKRNDPPVEIQMGPMIDMVFLLLVFFMVSARPIKPESDINLGLPGSVAQDEAVNIPDEQRIEIRPDGTVILNEQVVGSPSDQKLHQLIGLLDRFKKAADAARSDTLVTLAPDDSVPHQRVVDVLNACAKANIHGVTFADTFDE